MKSVGVGKGDAVVIYLPMLLELPIAMLACARIGAVHSVMMATKSSMCYSGWSCLHFMTPKFLAGGVCWLFCGFASPKDR